MLCVVFACLSCWWAASCTARELIIPLSIAGEALAVRYEPEDLVDSAFSRFVRETPWPLTRDSLASQARRAFQAVRRMPGPFMWQRASARILERADGSLCAVWEH